VKRDLQLQWQLFIGVAAFIALITIVYWFVSYEDAGTTMLALSAGLALLFGGWLFLQDRKAAHQPAAGEEARDAYLPDSSMWPFIVGLGAALALNGFILGWAYAVPGTAVLAIGMLGFIAQSRRRL
jgi:hypothetical protein